jgi:hypothetical protein
MIPEEIAADRQQPASKCCPAAPCVYPPKCPEQCFLNEILQILLIRTQTVEKPGQRLGVPPYQLRGCLLIAVAVCRYEGWISCGVGSD